MSTARKTRKAARPKAPKLTARFLAFSAREAVETFTTSPTEKEIGYFADALAVEVEGLADRIESRIKRKSSLQRRRADVESDTAPGRARRSAEDA